MVSNVFKVIYQDDSILVIEKLQPFLSQRGNEGDHEGLYEFISRTLKCSVFPVHRLDRDVLGLMIFGKTKSAGEALSDQFRERQVRKQYSARVFGTVTENKGTLVHYLKKNLKTNYVTVYIRPTEGAKYAELTYEVVSRGDRVTTLLIDLHTGRSHQIRVQLAKIGHPLIGDSKYGKKTSPLPIQLKSVFLSVIHPVTQERMTWEIEKFL